MSNFQQYIDEVTQLRQQFVDKTEELRQLEYQLELEENRLKKRGPGSFGGGFGRPRLPPLKSPKFGDGIKIPKLSAQKTFISRTYLKLIKQIEKVKALLLQLQASINSIYTNIWILGDPQTLIENWNDAYPIVLFPVKLETRFIDDPAHGQTLCVRFFPDDILITNHESELTPGEKKSGQTFWQLRWEAVGQTKGAQIAIHKAAWKVLAQAHGPTRAAYIALQTQPANWPADLTIPLAPLTPAFPTRDQKRGGWTLPARSFQMPDKFVVRLYNGNSYREATANTITAYPLIAGPDPQSEDDIFDQPGILWMFDFEKAVQTGMGIRIPLSNQEYIDGFDKILVLGLRITTNTTNGEQLLNRLVEDHHYGIDGLSFVPQGTPTNNTKDTSTGVSLLRPDIQATFQVERQHPLIDDHATVSAADWTNGHWLGAALGMTGNPFAHIQYSDLPERRYCQNLNNALWPATLGYYLKHLLCNWLQLDQASFDQTEIDGIKDFFVQHVSGRGPLPAFRIGAQPYAIIPTSAYSRMSWVASDSTANSIQKALTFFRASWQEKVGDVHTVHNGTSDIQQNFIDILGLDAGSVTYQQRYGIGPLFYHFFRILIGQNPNSWLVNKWNAVSQKIDRVNNLVSSDDLVNDRARQLMLTWFPFGLKFEGALVTDRPLSSTVPLHDNYLAYISDTANITAIVNNYLQGNIAYQNLLYSLLRHALLLEIWEVLWEAIENDPWLERELLNFESKGDCDSVWKYFYLNNGDGSVSLPDLTLDPRIIAWCKEVGALQDSIPSGTASIPTAELDLLLREHIDLCAYRLDAWQTGLVNHRLESMRKNQPTGTYLGAFGWLLNVRSGDVRTPVAATEIPDNFVDNTATHPLTDEEGNAGFIHSPSIAQATTAAILRENYVSKERRAMAISLTSRRVRIAKAIIQGLQNGQELGALLGYHFERDLHERSAASNGALELDQYIYELRRHYPLSTPADAGEVVEANNVVHGYNLLQDYRNNTSQILQYIASQHQAAITESVEGLAEIIDAVADLTMAEGIHQTVMGNHARANAILNAIGEGKMIPDPDFIKTPRTGTVLTQRMGVFIKALDNPLNPWTSSKIGGSTIARTARAKMSPYLNEWMGTLLPDPTEVFCKAHYSLTDGTSYDVECSLHALELQPIDVIYLFNDAVQEDTSALARIVALKVRNDNQLDYDIKVQVDFRDRTGWPASRRTFYELLSLCKSIYKLVTESELMRPDHLYTSASLDTDTPPLMHYDFADMLGRIDSANISDIRDTLQHYYDEMKIRIDSGLSPGSNNFAQLRSSLEAAAALGIYEAIPRAMKPSSQAVIQIAMAQASKVLEELERRVSKDLGLQADYTALSLTETEKGLEVILERARNIFGKNMQLLPRFKLTNYNDIKGTYVDKDSLLRKATTPLVMDEWLQGAAKVDDKVRNWQLLSLLQSTIDSVGASNLNIRPLQLPYQVNDQWLGIEFDPDEPDFLLSGAPLSLVLNFPFGFVANANKYCCGMIFTEWTEQLPSRSEMTGIAFNYDEPQAEPPQALLLAVPPKIRGHWEWDDLMATLNETLEMAQLRAVDPDLLGESTGAAFNPYLPGLMTAITSDHEQTVSLDFNTLVNRSQST